MDDSVLQSLIARELDVDSARIAVVKDSGDRAAQHRVRLSGPVVDDDQDGPATCVQESWKESPDPAVPALMDYDVRVSWGWCRSEDPL